jgi:hypothetical protein
MDTKLVLEFILQKIIWVHNTKHKIINAATCQYQKWEKIYNSGIQKPKQKQPTVTQPDCIYNLAEAHKNITNQKP